MVVYCFKRDLRILDNSALAHALSSGREILLLYIYEPSLWSESHYSERHKNFVVESLLNLQEQLKRYDTKILVVQEEAVATLEELLKLGLTELFSNEETGIAISYKRDLQVSTFCSENNLAWHQFQCNGVLRGIKNRNNWSKKWYRYMTSQQDHPNWDEAKLMKLSKVDAISDRFKLLILCKKSHHFQMGGEHSGHKTMDDFFNNRVQYYSDYISKPEQSRIGCSRLSPYLSWGNLSIRQVYQRMKAEKEHSHHKRALNAFSSRLRWQSHFIQKFEQEPRQEFEALNKGFLDMPQPLNEKYVNAWKEGQTGYPLVDASMRAVKETGYLNFRMRCMVTSFLYHHLFQHFTTGSDWLARQFLDWEAGIHYCQFQMQAALTGINTVRIYNPTKNAKDHDSDAVFIKKYVPELKNLPSKYAIEPWLLEDDNDYNFHYGEDYPQRIIDMKQTRAHALKMLYGYRKNDLAKIEKQRILNTHAIKRK